MMPTHPFDTVPNGRVSDDEPWNKVFASGLNPMYVPDDDMPLVAGAVLICHPFLDLSHWDLMTEMALSFVTKTGKDLWVVRTESHWTVFTVEDPFGDGDKDDEGVEEGAESNDWTRNCAFFGVFRNVDGVVAFQLLGAS